MYLVGSGEMGLSDPSDCHIYLIDGGSELALIDAGIGSAASLQAIETAMEQHGLDPARLTTLLLTHWHIDHANGANQLRERFGCKVWAPAGEREFVESGRDNLTPCPVDRVIEHGSRIAVGELELMASSVPGHSESTTVFLLETSEGRSLFCGDVLFFNGTIGLINYPGSDLSAYRAYIGRLADLNVDALLPGHGLFTVRNGQRHIDLAIRRLLESGFVPASIGQHGISFLPSSGFDQ